MNLREIARKVLSDTPRAMSARDVWAEVVRCGLDKQVGSKGKTPDATIAAYLYVASKKRDSGIVAEGRKPTLFRFVGGKPHSANPQILPATPVNPKSEHKEQNSKFIGPCVEVLSAHQGVAMGVGAILKAVLAAHPELPWNKSNGAVRAALLRAAKLGSPIRQVPDSNPPSFFVGEAQSVNPQGNNMSPITTNKTAGWVYILTNPSFREDWVKIGKSSRPVNVRSKELDNTAVPLPFEIFATLKTEKYAIVEQNIHNWIDELTNLRIRHNREFFNITPEKAFKFLEKEARLLDDAELLRYDHNEPIGCETTTRTKEIKKKKLPETPRHKDVVSEWRTTRRGIIGRMRISGGQYEVLPGSDICMNCEPQANEKVKKLRLELQRSGHIVQEANGQWKLKKTVPFSSPSSAAVFVLGGSVNGWDEWKNAEGKNLQTIRENLP